MACTDSFMKGCAGKTQHKTKLSANYFLQNEHSDGASEVYKCKICGRFHIGKSKKNTRESKTVKPKKRVNEEQHKRKHKRFKY